MVCLEITNKADTYRCRRKTSRYCAEWSKNQAIMLASRALDSKPQIIIIGASIASSLIMHIENYESLKKILSWKRKMKLVYCSSIKRFSPIRKKKMTSVMEVKRV